MAGIVIERYDSEAGVVTDDGDGDARTLIFMVTGEISQAVAESLVLAAAPLFYGDLKRKEMRCTHLGGGVHEATVDYAPPPPIDPILSFDTTGGSQHIQHSRETVAKVALPGVQAPDFENAIGVSEDNVAGTDITVPVFNFSETHYLDPSAVTQSYKLALFRLTGRVNNATFRGFAAGEVLFLGAQGSQRGSDERWELTFNFAASPHVQGLQVGNLQPVDKEGWHYLWVRFRDAEDARTLIKRPFAAYVERVYEEDDFGDLGI